MNLIRLATPEDASGILDIYAPYILNTSFTFETEVPSLEEFGERIKTYLNYWPWLVCEMEGNIAGYAYATRYRDRTAYQWSVECSVYVQDDHHRSGIGRVLYRSLFSILKAQGFTKVYAVINLPNTQSVTFHETMGFKYFATYEKVGYKLGKWKDVGWWQLQLNEYADEPPTPIKFSALDNEILLGLLNSK